MAPSWFVWDYSRKRVQGGHKFLRCLGYGHFSMQSSPQAANRPSASEPSFPETLR